MTLVSLVLSFFSIFLILPALYRIIRGGRTKVEFIVLVVALAVLVTISNYTL
jgi:divalent metal cation (Fe/Co/Zn/Cd) transporter